MLKKLLNYCLCTAALAGAGQSAVWAHAFPSRSQPQVGSVIDHSPKQARVWFNGEIAKHFSHMHVDNAQGKRVSKDDGHVAGDNDKLLEAELPPLPSGKYHLFWNVVGRDGHRTQGDFYFTIKKH